MAGQVIVRLLEGNAMAYRVSFGAKDLEVEKANRSVTVMKFQLDVRVTEVEEIVGSTQVFEGVVPQKKLSFWYLS